MRRPEGRAGKRQRAENLLRLYHVFCNVLNMLLFIFIYFFLRIHQALQAS